MDIKIIFENKDFLVVSKPAGLPSAPLHSLDEESALTKVVKNYPEVLKINGKKSIEYGLLHRLDTVTEGLLLIALNQTFYDNMIIEQEKNLFIKTYYAECDIESDIEKKEGFPVFPFRLKPVPNFSLSIESYFRAYGKGKKEVRPVINNDNSYGNKKANFNKKYVTNVKIINIKKDCCAVECKITQGFRHQVRNHLAWAGLPIKGDSLYNKNTRESNIKFYAVGLDFSYNGQDYSFRLEDF